MELTDALREILANRLVQILLTIIVALLLQMFFRAPIERIVRRAIRSHKYSTKEEEKKREDTLVTIFHAGLSVIIWIVAIIVILIQLKVNFAGLLTGAGLIGIVVGVGAQGAIKDFLAGVFIILENQYRVGDIVRFSAAGGADVSGVVEDITVRITKLRDLDGNLHIVSNGTVGVITNMTFQYANVNIDIPISYTSDIDKVRKIINDVGIDLAGDTELGPSVIEAIQFLRVDSFDASVMTVKALGKVSAGMQWDVAGEFRRRLKMAFDKKHIDMPYPQVVVHEEPPHGLHAK
jgi:small-conductance mechanosensitive channel